MKIGVIGLGVVGGTIYHAMKFYHEKVMGYDKYNNSDSFEDVCKADIIFLAVPTNEKNGRLDCSLVSDVLKELETASYEGIVCVKSSIGVNYLEQARKLNLRIVYMPEFLHEKSRMNDFISPDHIVMSGSREDLDVMRKAFFWVEDEKFFVVDDRTAEATKLAINAFAAMKISFANEIAMISREVGADAEKIMEILRNNRRCAPEYTDPTLGPYGGKCLPKDTRELINCFNKSILLKSVEAVNEEMKKNKKTNRWRTEEKNCLISGKHSD